MDIKPIRGEADYERALRRVEELWNSREGSAASDELDILATLIEAYEQEHYLNCRNCIRLNSPIRLKQSNSGWNRKAKTCAH